MADQYSLNVLLTGAWGELDPRWNTIAALYRLPSWEASPLSPAEFEAVLSDPYIVHWAGPDKPWQWGSRTWQARRFHRTRARTAWSGTRGALTVARATRDERMRRVRRPLRRMLRRARRRTRGARRALQKARWIAASRVRSGIRRLTGAGRS